MVWQQTLRHHFVICGIGLHTGCLVRCEVWPDKIDSGITFVRTDLPDKPAIPALIHHLHSTQLATTLAVEHQGQRVTVGTVEHILSALYALQIDNARVLIDGCELPVLDGSAALWAENIVSTGAAKQPRKRRYLRVRQQVRVESGNKWASLSAHDSLSIGSTLDFDHPLIAASRFYFNVDQHAYLKDIAPARTFCFRHEIADLKSKGLAKGGSLENAIVLEGPGVVNPCGLRFADECARHKVLDALGDLSLVGAQILGHLELFCTGHTLNAELVRAILAHPENLQWVTPPTPHAQEQGNCSSIADAYSVRKTSFACGSNEAV